MQKCLKNSSWAFIYSTKSPTLQFDLISFLRKESQKAKSNKKLLSLYSWKVEDISNVLSFHLFSLRWQIDLTEPLARVKQGLQAVPYVKQYCMFLTWIPHYRFKNPPAFIIAILSIDTNGEIEGKGIQTHIFCFSSSILVYFILSSW